MNYFADSYFHIGASHLGAGRPCQDYALHDSCPHGAYGIVADGCSTGRHTDVGARVFAWAARQALGKRAYGAVGDIGAAILDQAIQNAGPIGLTPQDMLSTCGYVVLSKGRGLIHLHGDGVIAYVISGALYLMRYDWDGNRPAYPIYNADIFRNNFVEAHGGDPGAHRLTVTGCTIMDDWRNDWHGSMSLAEGMRGVSHIFEHAQPTVACVFSDGICQVDGIDWVQAVQQCLAFKTTAGEFAKRRMIGFVRESQKIGRGPLDDIAYAVVRAEEEEA